MKNKMLVSMIGCLLFISAIAQSFREDFITALNAKDMEDAEVILRFWDIADANDPDLYIAYFNFYTVKSINESTPLATGYDLNYSKKALEYISEGIERFPTRFDMRIAKNYMLRELKNYSEYISDILKLIVYSDKIKNNWKGEDYTQLRYAEDMFFGVVLDCQEFLFATGDTLFYKDIKKISEEMLKFYPNHVQSLLSCSTVYLAQNDYDKSFEALQKAIAMEPTNAILLYNIAYVYYVKGDKANAKKYFELTLTNCKDQEEKIKDAAQRRLDELK